MGLLSGMRGGCLRTQNVLGFQVAKQKPREAKPLAQSSRAIRRLGVSIHTGPSTHVPARPRQTAQPQALGATGQTRGEKGTALSP